MFRYSVAGHLLPLRILNRKMYTCRYACEFCVTHVNISDTPGASWEGSASASQASASGMGLRRVLLSPAQSSSAFPAFSVSGVPDFLQFFAVSVIYPLACILGNNFNILI